MDRKFKRKAFINKINYFLTT